MSVSRSRGLKFDVGSSRLSFLTSSLPHIFTSRARILAVLLLMILAAAIAPAAGAQALPSQVLSLYPPETGELVFVDLRALRGTRHYSQVKSQVLPERYRQLEQFAAILGINFETAVHQMSWGFVGVPDTQSAEFAGVAEGVFSLADVRRRARQNGLGASEVEGQLAVSMGKNSAGQEFVFAFPDASRIVFGFRGVVEGMLGRFARSGPSLTNNAAVNALISEVNGRAPLWLVTDKRYTVFAIKQLLPEAQNLPGFEDLSGRLESAVIRFDLRDGLRTQAAVSCQNASDAMLLSTILQGAITYQAFRVNESNPEMARLLRETSVTRREQRIEVGMNVADGDLVALLQKNALQLNF